MVLQSTVLGRLLARRSTTATAIAFVCVTAFTLGVAQPASASVYRYNVISKSATLHVTGTIFASCKITTAGGSCGISKGKSFTRTVGTSLGATRADVAVGLSISSADSETTTVGCTSPKLRAGQIWHARALGTRFTYKVQKQQAYKPRVGPTRWKTVGTSSQLQAYDPSANGISCGL
ncbi:hypothetical protein [Microbacterium algeriense]|uniref:hypothetical protein n=1 Tax=Microbacterium algeriense TaxID=2615184 RepID=UPI0022E7417F|nr:hypothetical protein [Microbacterium algeriense]